MLAPLVQGIIRRVQEDGPDRGNVDLDILPRSVRYKLRDIMDDVRALMYLVFCCKNLCRSLQECFQGAHASRLVGVQGRISKNDVDARMLKALADLPVDLGCEAVEKFAMASLDSVRSKTGFMVRK